MYNNPYDTRQTARETARYTGAALEARSGLLVKVAGLLAFSMAFTALGALIGMRAPGLAMPAFIGVMILSFAIGFARNVPGLNLALLYLLTTLAGVGLGGIVELYVRAGAGTAVVQAGGTTALLTLGLSMYALTTKRDFSGLGPKLFIGVLALVAASIVGIFVQATLLHLIIGLAGAVVFSLFLVYQIQQARVVEDTLPNAILVTVGIYLSIINLFTSLLRIFGIMGGGDD